MSIFSKKMQKRTPPRGRGQWAPRRVTRDTGGNCEKGSVVHFGADLLAQHINRDQLPIALELPVGPAIAGRRVFHRRAHLMDRSAMLC